MRIPKLSAKREQVTAFLLRLLAVDIGICALPFLGEGFENLVVGGRLLWPLACFAMAAVPIAISVGLWRRQRWVRTVALGASVLAIPLLPLLTIAAAIASYSAGVIAIELALFLGLLAALIVYFLTSPDTKALFGVSPEKAGRQSSMVPRPLLGIILLAAVVIVGGVAAVSIASRAAAQRRQAAIEAPINERIVRELKPLIEAELQSMGADGLASRHCGAFQSLDQVRFTRMSFPTGVSSNVLTGFAHFEKADFFIDIHVADGDQASVELRFWPDENWLREHPQTRVRIVDRQLVLSEDFGGEHASTRSGGVGHISGTATHPDLVPSN